MSNSVHKDRRLREHSSSWVRSFACEDLKPLIVCRGPIRKEAMDVFAEMGMSHVGILLSEKDSIVYPNALAPELRTIRPQFVHRVSDYTGATADEKRQRMEQIVAIAMANGYNAIFAGYGFMSEDAEFVKTIEDSGLNFIGPCARTQQAAGQKDEAKRTAERVGVSTTPGVDDLESRAVKARFPNADALASAARDMGLGVPPEVFQRDFDEAIRQCLDAARADGRDLVDIDQLAEQVSVEVRAMLQAHPGRRIRLKAVGSGGGKGQRVLPVPDREDEASRATRGREASELFREVLAEVKSTGPGDTKNVLLELNIDQTRHHEIQLVGNGEWAISLGGRDCSLQMHEQKLLEISITQEALKDEIILARQQGETAKAESLTRDLTVLERMEGEAERFGVAVGLDSASTFECIVDEDRHYFMEMNTRIQVEHRVSELCYGLRFTNPDDSEDSFDVESLVEAMAIIARHGSRLPRPTRFKRAGAAVEARLNATDCSLSPHAGGTIIRWSDPLSFEIRDDQGISIKNPDTGQFMQYRLAGAYDSNIALLVSSAESREEAMGQLWEILRVTKLRGRDLCTNLEFHYGLTNWLRLNGVYAQATTAFVKPYLAAVAELHACCRELDFEFAAGLALKAGTAGAPGGPKGPFASRAREVVAQKKTLIERAIDHLLEEPHLLAGWLCRHRSTFEQSGDHFEWKTNPLDVLADTYFFLNMDYRPDLPAAHCIWAHDAELLARGQSFYRSVEGRLGTKDWSEVCAVLDRPEPSGRFDLETWARVRSSHAGFQLGMEILGLIPRAAFDVGFFDLKVETDLSIDLPEKLLGEEAYLRAKRVLAPPPQTKADEIAAVTGGMFYAREAPDRPPLVQVGDHFEKGQPLYVIEVMKMFNKVGAPFSGTVDAILLQDADGTVVAKGQPIFKVTPDEKFEVEDPKLVAQRRQAYTSRLMPSATLSS
ncbi:MAG: biotin carboxylase N-terminal domain-containing protein [Myxococcota bacterium]